MKEKADERREMGKKNKKRNDMIKNRERQRSRDIKYLEEFPPEFWSYTNTRD